MTSHRSALTSLACALALAASTVLVAAGASATAHDGARAAVRHRAQSTVLVGTYNVKSTLRPEVAVADIEKLARTGADVMSLQEMGGGPRRAALREALVDCDGCAYDAFMPDAPAQNATPILYRSDRFRLLGTGAVQVSEATYVGRQGAGPSTLRAKFINFVKLRDRATGRRLDVLNNHTVPTVQAKDGSANERMAARLRLYRKHMRGLQHLVRDLRATGAAVVATGDFNVNYRRDRVVQDPLFPYVRMHQAGAWSSYEKLGEAHRGTHVLRSGNDTRLIDYVFAARHPAVTAENQRVLYGYSSDHRPLLVRLGLAGRR